jgi:hypothetical protein
VTKVSDEGYVLPILLACAVLAALVVLIWWRVRRRREVAEFKQSTLAAFAYRKDMDRILAARGIQVTVAAGQDQVVQEVVSVARWIGREAVRRAKPPQIALDADDRFLGMLVAMVSAKHLSRLGEVSFETTSMLACVMLDAELGGKLGQAEVGAVVDMYNRMSSGENSKVILAIGTQVAGFCSSNEDRYLNTLGQLFLLLRQHLKPAIS